jgi:hypothetical protein
MIITEDFARRTIEEVAPHIEELSGLKVNLGGLVILMSDSKENAASYSEITNVIEVSESILDKYNKDSFKEALSHELTHLGQYSNFKDLSWRDYFARTTSSMPNEQNPVTSLIEGDATLIMRTFRNRYNPTNQEKICPKDYFAWSEILRKRFNGKRKDINELYTAPIKELNKIFGIN